MGSTDLYHMYDIFYICTVVVVADLPANPIAFHEQSGNVARAMIRRTEVVAEYFNFTLTPATISLLIISSDPSHELFVMDDQH